MKIFVCTRKWYAFVYIVHLFVTMFATHVPLPPPVPVLLFDILKSVDTDLKVVAHI